MPEVPPSAAGLPNPVRLPVAQQALGWFARPVSFARSDVVLMVGAAGLAVAVTSAGIALGTWRAVWS